MPQRDFTDVKAISYDDYLKLVGLLTLADEHNKALGQIEIAAAKITGEFEKAETQGRGDYGLTSDEVIEGSPDAADLLRRLGILVEPPLETAGAGGS